MVERDTENIEVVGSIPPPGTKFIRGCRIVVITRHCQCRDGGSIPLTRSSINFLGIPCIVKKTRLTAGYNRTKFGFSENTFRQYL